MKHVHAHKAQPVGSSTPEAVTILIKDELPDMINSDPDEVMAVEASRIAAALWDALPGGTLDALYMALEAELQASRVPRRPPEELRDHCPCCGASWSPAEAARAEGGHG